MKARPLQAHRMVRRHTLAAATLSLATLAGCSSISEFMSGDKVDYRSASTKSGGLDIPPDLTQLTREQRSSSGGSVSASSMAPPSQGTVVAAPPTPARPITLSIERQGDQRWLSTSLSPEQAWPQVLEFWKERGLNVESEQADVGVIETEWAENRAKLPQDIIRRTIGKLIDGMYSTGERDKFRTRIERTPSGGSEIFITHRGMVEVYTNTRSDNTVWQMRPTDTQLEAIFLQRLMMKLGATEDQSKAAVANVTTTQPKARLLDRSGRPVLEIDDPFDRAWRRVGVSLDRTGFTVEDRDRSKGLYFVRYVDPKEVNKEQPGLFARMFSKNTGPALEKYRVQVKTEGTRTSASVLNEQGADAPAESAQRILRLLADDLK